MFQYSPIRIYLFAILLIVVSFHTNAQVGIGTTTPVESSLLDIDGDDKGILVPRVDITNLTSQAPITGTIVESLLVYNTNTTTGKGFYYWSTDDTEWKKLSSGDDDANGSIYSTNGTLTADRTVEFDDNNLVFENNGNAIFQFERNGRLRLREYGGTNFLSGTPQNLIAVDAAGNVVEIPADAAYQTANQDWYEEGTTRAPNNIDDNIWTNGEVGIGTNAPNSSLHVFEDVGTAPSFVNGIPTGSMVLEHGDNGGASSIVFRSAVNRNSDYGYISFEDNGTVGTSTENALLTIGIQNDVEGSNTQDDIKIAASGELLISVGDPSVNDYYFENEAFRPFADNVNDLGLINNRWKTLFAINTLATNTLANNVFANNIFADNNIQFSDYGIGARVGTPTYTLGVDAAGNVVEVDAVDAEINDAVQFINTLADDNLNASTTVREEVAIFSNASFNDNGTLYTITDNENLSINSVGRYQVVVNLSLTSGAQRPNLKVQLTLDNNPVGAVAANAYIRNNQGHDNSSINFTEIINVTAGQELSISTLREANIGTVVMNVGESSVTVIKIK